MKYFFVFFCLFDFVFWGGFGEAGSATREHCHGNTLDATKRAMETGMKNRVLIFLDSSQAEKGCLGGHFMYLFILNFY